MIIVLPLLVALIGLLLFVLASKADPKEIGRILFFCGVLAFLLRSAEPLVKLLR